MHLDGLKQNFDWWQIWQSYMRSDSSGPFLSSEFGPTAIVRYSVLAKCCSLVTGTCVCFFLWRQSRVALRGQIFEDFAKTMRLKREKVSVNTCFGEDLADLGAGCWRVLEDEGRFSGVLDLSFVCFFFLGDPPFLGVGVLVVITKNTSILHVLDALNTFQIKYMYFKHWLKYGEILLTYWNIGNIYIQRSNVWK